MRSGSLRLRIGLLVGLAMLILAGIFFGLVSHMLDNYFGRLQDSFTASRLKQIAVILDQDARAKENITHDDAAWDETYSYLQGTNPDYLRTNYDPAVNTSGQDVVLIFDSSRRLVGAVTRDQKENPYVPPPGLDLASLSQGALFGPTIKAGLATTDRGIILLDSCPVTKSDASGPSLGWLVFGTYLDSKRLVELGQMSGTLMSWSQSKDDGSISGQTQTDLLGLVDLHFPSVSTIGPDTVDLPGRLTFHSAAGATPINLDVALPIRVYREAMQAKNSIVLASGLCGLLVMAAGFLVFEFVVIRPLVDLDRRMQKMTEAPFSMNLLETNRVDEIGRLAHSANALLNNVVARRDEAEEGKTLLSSVLNSTIEGVIALRAVRDEAGFIKDLEVVLLNKSAERLFGLKAAELIGQSIRSSPGLSENIYDRTARAIESKQATHFEKRSGGVESQAWLYLSIALWRDGAVVTCEDISERKLREQQLADSYREMDRFNTAMIGREERIMAMKAEVNELRARLGLPRLYDTDPHV